MDLIDRAEFRKILVSWRDASADVDDEEGCGLLEDVITELDAQTPLAESDRQDELAEADRDNRLVIFQPGYPIVSVYEPKDEDGLYIKRVTGVITEEEYKSVGREEED